MSHCFLLCLLALPLFSPAQAFTEHEYFALGETFGNEKSYNKAIAMYQQVLKLNPAHRDAMFNLASILYEQRNFDEALVYFQKVIAVDPSCIPAHYNAGVCLKNLNKHGDALLELNATIELDPTHSNAYVQIGSILEALGKTDLAFANYKRLLSFDEQCFEAHYRIGVLYRNYDHFDDALKHLRTAYDLDSEHVNVTIELANTLHLMGGSEECIDLYKKALAKAPNNIGVLYNLGYTYKRFGFIEEALAIYDQVIARKPDYALARFSRALTYLALGDFERGWQEYEWRWAAYNDKKQKFAHIPAWQGEELAGKTILVHCEQGLGDSFQFIRFAQPLKALGATVIVETQSPLKTLLSRCPYIDRVYARGESIPVCDYQIALMSLPLQLKATADTIPSDFPYITADPALVEYWRERLSHDTNFKIGICWQGNPNYSTQALRQAVAAKSFNVTTFEPIMLMQGVSVYNLQMVSGTDQIADLSDPSLVKTFDGDFDNNHGRFMDTAAVMPNLDLIISVDTSTCHLAGALNVPVWVLLPKPADWRWMLETTDTPWYPTMRLFRQQTMGQWNDIVEQIVTALQPLVQAHQEKVTSH